MSGGLVDASDTAVQPSEAVMLRFIWRGETLRNGRILSIVQGSYDDVAATCIHGTVLLKTLLSSCCRKNVAVERVIPYYYSQVDEGWKRLHPSSMVPIPAGTRRIEIMLEQPATSASLSATECSAEAAEGFHG